MKLSERLSRLGTETAFEVLVRARALEAQGKSVIHLEIGEPDFDTPAHVTEAAIEALQSGATHYGPAAGLPELRQAIAEDSMARRGAKATPEMVVVTPGGKPVMFYTILALIDPGDEVLYPNPGFPIYESMIRYIGGIPIPVRLLEDRAFELDVDQLVSRVGPKTRLIVINHPHNPTGGTIPEAGLRAIAEVAARHGIPVLADEIYSELLYEGQHASIASMPGMEPHAIVLDGFSKTYAMTGWRLGYGIMPAPLAEVVAKLQTNAVSCTATFTQKAGVAALKGDKEPVRAMRAEFRRRRDAIVAGLRKIPGFTCPQPKGAFYVFPNIARTGYPSKKLADRLLAQGGVACLSGTAFGEWGEGHLRFSYANSLENIEEALSRIRKVLGEVVAVFVALLRAVNVGGTGKLVMSELRRLCEDAGLEDVATYIQSGNVVFSSGLPLAKVRQKLEAALGKKMGQPVGVHLRTPRELEAIVGRNPFPAAAPNRVLVLFLDRAPSRGALADLPVPGREEVELSGREVFVHYPDGMGQSKLKLPFAGATGRNLNTVRKLLDLARAASGRA